MTRNLRNIPVLSLVFLFLFGACTGDKGRKIPDVSNVSIDLKISRFDQSLMKLDTMQVFSEMKALEAEYPSFFTPVFRGKIIPMLRDSNVFSQFVRADVIRNLLDTTQIVFGDFAKEKKSLESAFQFFHHYLPNRPIPEIVTYISEYSIGSFTYENMLGIGLDFYLGADYPKYSVDYFPRYITRTMEPEYLTAKSMKTLLTDIVGNMDKQRLLDIMVNNGKILYMLDELMPYTADSTKLEFKQPQVDWVEENELQIWSHLVGEELLYSEQRKDFQKLVDYSPNSPGMPNEAPGRTANWLGMRIVKAYMRKFPQTTWEELIAMKDAQVILNRSKYKPKR